MKHVRLLFSLIVPALLLILVACGNNNSPNIYTNPTNTPAPTTSPTGAVINTASETVKGKSVTALTNDKGWTLYYFTPDTATTSNCTGACATTWPPVTSNGTPTSKDTLPGGLNVQTNGNGSQVTYQGHPLYTFKNDTGPGQTNGEGKANNTWHVATTDLTVIAGAIGTTSEMVKGQSVKALTNDKGWTLYYFTPDTATTSNCTGACATTWPPATSKSAPVSTTALPGMLGLQTNANGSQVTYQGHPLYTFKNDTGPGQTNGEGKANNTWHVATIDLTMLGGSSPAPTPTSSSGGYNY